MLAAEQTILQNPEESHKKGMVFEYITSQICQDFAQESYKINGATKCHEKKPVIFHQL